MLPALLAAPCDPVVNTVTTVTVGSLLNQLGDKVDKAPQEAQVTGTELLLEAGDQAYLAINNAKSGYADILDQTLNKVDPARKGQARSNPRHGLEIRKQDGTRP